MTRFRRYLLVSGIIAVIFIFITEGELEFSIFIGLFLGLLSLGFDTKEEKKEKKAAEKARKMEEEAKERARKAPGCHSMDNVDILTFKSSNNLLTAGNNFITLRIRNRNPYTVIVTIKYKYSDSEGWDKSTSSYEVGGNQMRTINAHGTAWRKAKDVSLVAVH